VSTRRDFLRLALGSAAAPSALLSLPDDTTAMSAMSGSWSEHHGAQPIVTARVELTTDFTAAKSKMRLKVGADEHIGLICTEAKVDLTKHDAADLHDTYFTLIALGGNPSIHTNISPKMANVEITGHLDGQPSVCYAWVDGQQYMLPYEMTKTVVHHGGCNMIEATLRGWIKVDLPLLKPWLDSRIVCVRSCPSCWQASASFVLNDNMQVFPARINDTSELRSWEDEGIITTHAETCYRCGVQAIRRKYFTLDQVTRLHIEPTSVQIGFGGTMPSDVFNMRPWIDQCPVVITINK